MSEIVWILTLDGCEISGWVSEYTCAENDSEGSYLVLKSRGSSIQILTENISQIVVYDQYDPPLPERNLHPSPEEKKAYRELLIKYREKAISQGHSTDSYDEALSKLQ